MKIAQKSFMTFLALLVVVGAIAVAAYFYQQNQDFKQHPEKVSQAELTTLQATIGRLIELPQDETPQLATVTDANQLKAEQSFFEKAQNGDKILIYSQAKKAFLFRPKTGKIIEVGPVTFGEALTAPTPIPTLTTESTISSSPVASPVPVNLNLVLLNGTTVIGLTSKPEAKLAQAAPELHIQAK